MKQLIRKPCTGVLATAILFLLVSCAQGELPDEKSNGQAALLGINNLQATDIDITQEVTRAVTTTNYPTANSIGFFVKADADNGYKAVNNRKGGYSTARKLWLPDATTPADSIWLNSHNADIAVYAPYNAAYTTATALDLAACLRPADGSKDIWCKHFTANNTSKSLAVTLEHVYTRLAVVVSRSGDYKSDAVLSALALKGDEIYQTAAYKPFETTPYAYGSATGLTPAVAPQALNASTASVTYDLLLIPATLTGDFMLTLTVNGKKMQVKVAKDKFAGNKLEAGKQYNINLKLQPGKLEITSVSVVKWDALAEVNGGQAEFDQLVVIDIGLDFLIAPGNLIATKQSEVTYEYDFAEEQGYYSNDGLSGDYFCWNTLEPTGSIKQSSWDDARDACRQVGDGKWYTPTQAQLQALVDAGNVWDIYTMKDGTTVNGRYFGTETAPVERKQDKYVFLPAAGCREGSTYIDVTTKGKYWSATLYSGNANNAYGFDFNSGNCPVTNFSRSYGRSVRCVRDK